MRGFLPSAFSVATFLLIKSVSAGNLHINIVADKWDPRVEEAIEPWIYGATGALVPLLLSTSALLTAFPLVPTAARNGSISAEHGLGLMKAPYLAYSKSDESIDVMQAVRKLFDPRGILSPCVSSFPLKHSLLDLGLI